MQEYHEIIEGPDREEGESGIIVPEPWGRALVQM